MNTSFKSEPGSCSEGVAHLIEEEKTLSSIQKAMSTAPEISTALVFFIFLFIITRLISLARIVYLQMNSFCQSHNGLWYFVGYDEGFTRRGLIGTLVSFIPNPDSQLMALGIASLLSTITIILLIALATFFARLSANPVRRLILFAVVLTSPLYASTFIRDWGRLDNVGVICGGISLYVLLCKRMPLALSMATASILIAIAAATEEFLPMYLIPVASIALWSRLSINRHRNTQFICRFVSFGAILCIPSLVIIIASAGTQVTPEFIESIAYRTETAMEEVSHPGTPLWALAQSPRTALSFIHSIPYQHFTIFLNAGVFTLTALCIYLLLRPAFTYWILVLCFSSISSSLCLIGADARRWWALSLVSLIAGCVALGQPKKHITFVQNLGEPVQDRKKIISTVVVIAVLTVAIIGQDLPLWGERFPVWIKSLYHAFIL